MMMFAMGDMGWPAFIFAIAAFVVAIALQRRLVRTEKRLSAIEADLASTK